MWRGLRDGALFVGGFFGFMHEVFAPGPSDPSLLVLCGAMMGLPAFLRKDEKGD